jgi:hypothetical protein
LALVGKPSSNVFEGVGGCSGEVSHGSIMPK